MLLQDRRRDGTQGAEVGRDREGDGAWRQDRGKAQERGHALEMRQDEVNEVGVVPAGCIGGDGAVGALDREEEPEELDPVDLVKCAPEDCFGHLLGHDGVEIDFGLLLWRERRRGTYRRQRSHPIGHEGVGDKLVAHTVDVEDVDRLLQRLREAQQPPKLICQRAPKGQLTGAQDW